MRCEKCNSENTVVTVVKKSNKGALFGGVMLLLTGLGLMFLGIIGALLGLVAGAIIGGIVAALMPTQHESVWVCQDCGHITKPKEQRQKKK